MVQLILKCIFQLSNVKKDIEELQNLEVIDLYNNFIQDMPISKKHLSKLTSFDIDCNKINTSTLKEVSMHKTFVKQGIKMCQEV